MTERAARHPVTLKRVLFDLPGTAQVEVRHGRRYLADDAAATLDLYYPPGWTGGAPLPAVVFVSGFSDAGAQRVLGCRVNEMESFVSWGRLVAASGMVGVTYTTGSDPAINVRQVLAFLHANGDTVGVNASQLGLWACSSHVPTALSALMDHQPSVQCAVLCYGFMLDLDGATDVADAERTWRFTNPARGRTVKDLPADTALCVVRAGRDETPGVNASIDRFAPAALASNLPFTLVNHHVAPHAFDLDDDSNVTRHIVGELLSFLRAQTSGRSASRHDGD